KDAVRIVRQRGRFMQEAVPEGRGAMTALIGLDTDAIRETCAAVSTEAAPVVAANINSPGQVVISGEAGAVAEAGRLLKERGAKRVIPLPVSVPSHSPMMSGAAENLAKELAEVTLSEFTVPIVTNVEATALSDTTRVRELLTRQLTSPVNWVATIEYMAGFGIDTIIEIGPSTVLSSLTRRIDKSITTVNVSEPKDLKKLANVL
ncbi:MAG: ACP S-malonyltransferase, partial [Thermodesulfobacteriota bacterium]